VSERSTPRVTPGGLREAGANLLAAGLYLVFAAAHLQGFARTPRPSLLLVVVLETVVAVLFMLRAPAARASSSLWAWVTTLGGTLAPFLLRPGDAASDVLVGQVIQCGGGVLALASLASLQRSFGLLPAVRGLRFGGPYRWVRHPIYAAYTVQNVGYLVSNATAWNVSVAAVALAFQVLRIYNEERILSSEPAYERYMRETRWRLVPRVF
jgi:protein-S-isoprenylcysteine O-methyltransferase Ste14